MICPKCGWEQPDNPACSRCGIVVSRYQRAGRVVAKEARSGTPVERGGARKATAVSWLEWLVLAASVAVFVVWVRGRAPTLPAASTAPPSKPVSAARRVALPSASAAPAPSPSAQGPPLPVLATAAPTEMAEESFPHATCPMFDRSLSNPPSRPPIGSLWYTKGDDYTQARDEGDTASAPVLVYVYTDWCPYCHAFEKGLLSDATVNSYLEENVVKLKVNPETGSAEKALEKQLGVTGYPTLLLFWPGGQRVERLSAFEKGPGHVLKSPEEFVGAIQSRVTGIGEALLIAGKRARYEQRPDESIALLTRVLQLRPNDAAVYLERALAHDQRGDVDDAVDDLAHVANLTPQANMEPLTQAEGILLRANRIDEAITCWSRFIEREPSLARGYVRRSRLLALKGLRSLSAKDAKAACELGERSACPSTAAASPLSGLVTFR